MTDNYGPPTHMDPETIAIFRGASALAREVATEKLDAIRVGSDYYAAADWVRARGGSCTSPAAVEFRMEDEWRVKTHDGARAPAVGDYLVFESGEFWALTPDQFDRLQGRLDGPR